MPAETEEITEDQANEALQQLVHKNESEAAVESAETAEEQPVEVEAVVADDTEQVQEEQAVEVAEPEGDDIESLRRRAEELEVKVKEEEERFQKRLEALQQRNAANEQILRDRYLRKSTIADKALRTLKATKSETGVSEADVDAVVRELEGTMHPDSASYVPPEPSGAATEDQALVLNSFLNEKGMTTDEADQFGNWIRTEASTAMSPAEQAVANQSIDGFLRLAHNRWQQGIRESEKQAKHSDAVGAVRSVQRTQREAARAASAPTAAPKKQPVERAKEIDVSKLTKDDVAALLRQSVEQYK